MSSLEIKLVDAQVKLQLAKSAIQTAIHELENDPSPCGSPWLEEYLREVLEHLK
jgi:hypothetical protein